MTDVAGRRVLWENDNLQGIIYHTVKFCDYYGFDYARLKKEIKLPILPDKRGCPLKSPAIIA